MPAASGTTMPPGLGFDSPGGYWASSSSGVVRKRRTAQSPARARHAASPPPAKEEPDAMKTPSKSSPKKSWNTTLMVTPPKTLVLGAPLTKMVVVHALALSGTFILAFGLIALSIICLVAPKFAAELYGLPTGETGWVAATGLRDFAFGVSTLALFALKKSALPVFVSTLLIVPIGDLALTCALGVNAGGIIAHSIGVVCIFTLSVFLNLDCDFK